MGRVDHPERGVSAEARISACRVARSEFARAFQFVAASTVPSGVNPCLNAGSADRTEATHVITHTLPLLDMPSRSWPSALLPLWAPAPPSHGDFISVPRSARLLDSYSRCRLPLCRPRADDSPCGRTGTGVRQPARLKGYPTDRPPAMKTRRGCKAPPAGGRLVPPDGDRAGRRGGALAGPPDRDKSQSRPLRGAGISGVRRKESAERWPQGARRRSSKQDDFCAPSTSGRRAEIAFFRRRPCPASIKHLCLPPPPRPRHPPLLGREGRCESW